MEAIIVVVLYVLGGALVVGLAAALYFRAVASRRYYCCSKCGERFRVELMGASHCNTCGAPIAHHMNRGDA